MESAQHFTTVEHEHLQGTLHVDHGQMMQGLLDDETIMLFVMCTTSKVDQSNHNSFKSSAVTLCTLDVVIYGPPFYTKKSATGLSNTKSSFKILGSVTWTQNISTLTDSPPLI